MTNEELSREIDPLLAELYLLSAQHPESITECTELVNKLLAEAAGYKMTVVAMALHSALVEIIRRGFEKGNWKKPKVN